MKTYTTPKIDPKLIDTLQKLFVDGKITANQLSKAIKDLYTQY